jgi:hypothetical protein
MNIDYFLFSIFHFPFYSITIFLTVFIPFEIFETRNVYTDVGYVDKSTT